VIAGSATCDHAAGLAAWGHYQDVGGEHVGNRSTPGSQPGPVSWWGPHRVGVGSADAPGSSRFAARPPTPITPRIG
jgi:hypothetical protein